jgi:hypothetical protein
MRAETACGGDGLVALGIKFVFFEGGVFVESNRRLLPLGFRWSSSCATKKKVVVYFSKEAKKGSPYNDNLVTDKPKDGHLPLRSSSPHQTKENTEGRDGEFTVWSPSKRMPAGMFNRLFLFRFGSAHASSSVFLNAPQRPFFFSRCGVQDHRFVAEDLTLQIGMKGLGEGLKERV